MCPYTHIGSPHWVGPVSFMQAKLHGGASTWRPPLPQAAASGARRTRANAGSAAAASASPRHNAAIALFMVVFLLFVRGRTVARQERPANGPASSLLDMRGFRKKPLVLVALPRSCM